MKLKFVLIWALIILTQNVFSQYHPADLNSLYGQHKAQSNSVKMNTELLLLGTLNDYINRKYVNSDGQFDQYNSYEMPLKKYVDSVVKKVFNITLTEKGDYYISEEMSKKMNAFYHGNRLIDSLLYIDTETKLSFLSGVFLRYGEKIEGHLYKVELVNSAKHLNCYEILKQLGCQKVYYKHLNNVPGRDLLYFEATPLMESYFALVAIYQEKILNARLAYYFKSSADPKESYLKIFGREHKKVQSLFSEEL
jgi:hypothetical protein